MKHLIYCLSIISFSALSITPSSADPTYGVFLPPPTWRHVQTILDVYTSPDKISSINISTQDSTFEDEETRFDRFLLKIKTPYTRNELVTCVPGKSARIREFHTIMLNNIVDMVQLVIELEHGIEIVTTGHLAGKPMNREATNAMQAMCKDDLKFHTEKSSL